LGEKFGERWWGPDPYPSKIVKDSHHPSHYDPLQNPKFSQPLNTDVMEVRPIISLEFYPKHCVRAVSAYRKCLMANDDNKKTCEHEGDDILGICPPFALDSMKENNKLKLKLEALANQKYRKVMEVP